MAVLTKVVPKLKRSVRIVGLSMVNQSLRCFSLIEGKVMNACTYL